jgi:hypothetical protein
MVQQTAANVGGKHIPQRTQPISAELAGRAELATGQSAESWKKQHEAAKRSELRKTVRPLPKQVAGPCGPAPEDGQCRRITIWDNRIELEQFYNFRDFTRIGRLGFQAGVIHKCGTFIVITDITTRFNHHPQNPKLELKYGYAKYNCERACKGTDPEFPWDNPPANRVQLASLISRYPHRARAAEYMIDPKFFTTDDDADDDDDDGDDINPTTPVDGRIRGAGDQPAARSTKAVPRRPDQQVGHARPKMMELDRRRRGQGTGRLRSRSATGRRSAGSSR